MKLGITGRHAMCVDCDWTEQANEPRTLVLAKRHAARLHHCVVVEIIHVIHYDERVKRAEEVK